MGNTNAIRVKGAIKFVNVDKNNFFNTLRKRVDAHFAQHQLSKFGDSKMIVKTLVLLTMYLIPFAILIITTPGWIVSLVLWALMGIGMAGLGMSVMHDANHGAYASNKTVNKLMSHVLNMMGGSTGNWKLQHNILHHTYTNITDFDDDIASKPALRLSPHTDRKNVHRYQWFHSFLLYGLTTLYWVTAKDFVQYFRYRKLGVESKSSNGTWTMAKLIFVKLVYFSVFILLPVLVFNIPFILVLTGFLLMHFIAGIILTVIFQLAHSLEGTSHPMPDNNGVIENDWAIHQMNTTMNFAPNNKLLSWYVGGLNFQVEHHLFPRIAHVHYPRIAPIVRATAIEYNIPYLEHNTFTQAFKAHVAFLKKLGRLPDLDEAIG